MRQRPGTPSVDAPTPTRGALEDLIEARLTAIEASLERWKAEAEDTFAEGLERLERKRKSVAARENNPRQQSNEPRFEDLSPEQQANWLDARYGGVVRRAQQ